MSPTILIALHGRFELHPWLDAAAVPDAYGLLYLRSAMTGRIAVPVGRGSGVSWEMNEAGQDWTASRLGHRVAWFQIGLPPAPDSESAMPILAAITEGVASVGRIGSLELGAVQVLVPLQIRSRPIHPAIGADWFENEDPAARVQVRLEVDAGTEAPLPIGDLRDSLARLDRSFLQFDTVHGPDSVLGLSPNGFDDEWMGPLRSPCVLDVSISAWSVDAVGWLVQLAIEACRYLGVDGPVMVTVSRVDVQS